MSGNHDKVLLDLNFPAFQEEIFDLDVSELKKVIKTLRKIKKLSWGELLADPGLKWEELKSAQGKYTVRLSLSYRAVVIRDGSFIRFQALYLDHDGANGKK